MINGLRSAPCEGKWFHSHGVRLGEIPSGYSFLSFRENSGEAILKCEESWLSVIYVTRNVKYHLSLFVSVINCNN